ncbi:MAG: DUF6788 family protein, partial [bacterium]
MSKELNKLLKKRKALYPKLENIGNLRRGTISVNYRKCGKKNCACAKPGHTGHPQYLRTTSKGGKNRAQTLRMGPELEKA